MIPMPFFIFKQKSVVFSKTFLQVSRNKVQDDHSFILQTAQASIILHSIKLARHHG